MLNIYVNKNENKKIPTKKKPIFISNSLNKMNKKK
jgi:hypothetical protein